METAVINKTWKKLGRIAAVVGTLMVIAGGVVFVRNNIWKPKVKIIDVDFDKGEAMIQIGRTNRKIYTGSITNVGAGWGVRFSQDNSKLELVKNNLVFNIIDQRL